MSTYSVEHKHCEMRGGAFVEIKTRVTITGNTSHAQQILRTMYLKGVITREVLENAS